VEILEYKQKIEVEISTFSGSLNTTLQREKIVSLTSACVYPRDIVSWFICMYFIQIISFRKINLDIVLGGFPQIDNLPLRVQSGQYFLNLRNVES